jgi:hypothetical protein
MEHPLTWAVIGLALVFTELLDKTRQGQAAAKG